MAPMSDSPRTVRYLGGPLDGQELDVSDWTDEQIATGVYRIVHGEVDRAAYAPVEGGDPLEWHFEGMVLD